MGGDVNGEVAPSGVADQGCKTGGSHRFGDLRFPMKISVKSMWLIHSILLLSL